jgi:signal transduction histidine kinase
MRNFIQGLGSELATEGGLVVALATLADELRLNSLIDVELDVADGAGAAAALTPEAADHLFHIAREALSNVARHSAASRATVALRPDGEEMRLVVVDNGRGFDPSEASAPGHFGLLNLRERALAVGGRLEVDSEPGAGTRIIVRLPIPTRETPGP